MNLHEQLRIGPIFSFVNRKGELLRRGSIEQICNSVAGKPDSIATIWGDPETIIKANIAKCSAMSTFSQQIRSIIEPVLTAVSGRNDQQEHLEQFLLTASGVKEVFRSALARALFIEGSLSISTLARLEGIINFYDQDKLGMTAIGWACALGSSNSIRWAIDANFKMEHRNTLGWNYADLAAQNKKLEALSLLRSFGVLAPGESLSARMRELGIPFKCKDTGYEIESERA